MVGHSSEAHMFSKHVLKNSAVDSNTSPHPLIKSLTSFRDRGTLSKEVQSELKFGA